MFELNFIDEKTSLEGKKFIFVTALLDFPITLSGDLASPFLNSTKYYFPSLSISSLSFSDNALTTESPTPCRPPDTL